MGRSISTRATAAFAAALAVLAASGPASWAQDDPTRQWFVCYGPQAQGRLAPPKKVYLSGVSTAIRVTGQTNLLITEAFHAFVLQKYGADFEPRCEGYSTQDQASRLVNNIGSRTAATEVEKTGWVWTQPESDRTPRPAPPPNPGDLGH